MTPQQQTPASVVEAATELSHFAWSAVRADCVEAEMNLNRLLGNLRAALTQGESRQTGGGDRFYAIKAAIEHAMQYETDGKPCGCIIEAGCEARRYHDPAYAANGFIWAAADAAMRAAFDQPLPAAPTPADGGGE